MKFLEKVLDILRSLMRPCPARDWYLVLGASIIILVLLISTSTQLFFGIRSGSIVTPLNDDFDPSPSVSREKLEEVVSAYELRRLNYSEGNIPTPNVSDPR